MAIVLRHGQYQLGSVRFGRFTNLPIESMEVTGYGVNSTDFQLPRADEMQFGIDTFQPGAINFTIGILDNYVLPTYGDPESISGIKRAHNLLEDLHTEWRSDDIRKQFGFVKPLLYGRPDGSTVRIYGRPRKFAHDAKSLKGQFRKAVAEFQRVDTLCYTEQEYSVQVLPSSEGSTTQNIVRSGGGAPTWMKIYITGPIVHPKIVIGSLPMIDINYTLTGSQILEINSYPWTRRVVDNNSLNIAPLLIGTSPYLDELMLPANSTIAVGFSGTGTTSATKMNILWREAFSTL